MTGQQLGHYQILEKLGEGGMGVVYKAEDTKLERTVALKFLAEHLLNDEDAKQRFLREAKAAAALSHPNICHVYEIDEANGKTFIAMEFLEGEPLEERIAKGPLPIKDALDIARQVAEGLQAAHEKNVVHRDIKPANILIDAKGRAVVMDFGLARLTEASRLTKVDTAMGTVAYMSPEQAQGMDVDHGTDVWALGCVLYEMVAGQRPFLGQYDQALLYEIVNEEAPPLTSIRAGVPMELEFIVTECLAKDREDRTGAAQEVARKLRTLAEKLKSGRSTILRTTNVTGAMPAVASQMSPAQTAPRPAPRVLQATAAVLALALAAVAFLHFREAPAPRLTVVEFSADLPPGLQPGQLSLSPDGAHLAMTVEPPGSLWVRTLDSVDWHELAGTQGARYPFWSPNSANIGFFADEKLKKIALAGGPPQTITAAADGRGGSWGNDGTIVFSPDPFGRIYRVAESGGESIQVTQTLEQGTSDRFPHLLPGGRHFLYDAGGASSELNGIYLGSLEGESPRRLLPDESNSIFVPRGPRDNAGFLLFVRERTLMAQPFNSLTVQLAGGPIALSVAPPYAGNAAFYGFSASDSGALAHSATNDMGMRRLVWVDRTGAVVDRTDLVAEGLLSIALSPDGKRVAYTALAGANADIWTYDFARQTRIRLSSQPGVDHAPVWAPDGKQIAFRAINPATFGDVYLVDTDGSSAPADLIAEIVEETPSDWSQDGRFILYEKRGEKTSYDLWYLERAAQGEGWERRLFLDTPARERTPRLSPNGRYVAYTSDESGQEEVYVQPFPAGGDRTAISTEGGTGPLWSRDGRELFYVAPGNTLVAVEVSTRGEFAVGGSKRLFQHPGMVDTFWYNYDVSLDGRRFLVAEPVAADGKPLPLTNSSIRFVLNWQAKLLPAN